MQILTLGLLTVKVCTLLVLDSSQESRLYSQIVWVSVLMLLPIIWVKLLKRLCLSLLICVMGIMSVSQHCYGINKQLLKFCSCLLIITSILLVLIDVETYRIFHSQPRVEFFLTPQLL
jgi:hypothetical protein